MCVSVCLNVARMGYLWLIIIMWIETGTEDNECKEYKPP